MRNRLSGLPLRWKLTVAFSAASAVVLTALGSFLYVRFAAVLDLALEADLRASSARIVSQVERSDIADLAAATRVPLEPAESFAQILRPDGSVVAASAHPEVRLLSAEQLRAASAGELLLDRPGDAAIDESLRLLAIPVRGPDGDLIVIVSASMDEHKDALASLWQLELVGLSAALLGSAAVGYVVAGFALRPVERLRRRAADITGEQLASAAGDPLPVSNVDDELGRLGETLNAMLRRIRDAQLTERQAVERERRFLADASHQLRTPLSIIKAEAELALAEPDGPGVLRDALISTGQEADRLTALADQLLTLAAADEQRLVQQREPLDVPTLLNTVAERHRQRATDSGRQIWVRAPAGVSVDGNRLRLEQLLNCLVDNALVHGNGDIELVARRGVSGVQLLVRDAGPGIGDDLAETAFERFRHGSQSRGAGLGLSIVQAIAQAHGGRVRLDHAGGGCVVVDLPDAATEVLPQNDRVPAG